MKCPHCDSKRIDEVQGFAGNIWYCLKCAFIFEKSEGMVK
jgi:ribosomal protein L37AE/L43A